MGVAHCTPQRGNYVRHRLLSARSIICHCGCANVHTGEFFPGLYWPSELILSAQVIASLLIILRVANGSAYSATTTNSSSNVSGSAEHGRSITSIRFAPSAQSTRSPYNAHYEMQDSKGIQLPMPAVLLNDPDTSAQNSASSIEPYPTFREV